MLQIFILIYILHFFINLNAKSVVEMNDNRPFSKKIIALYIPQLLHTTTDPLLLKDKKLSTMNAHLNRIKELGTIYTGFPVQRPFDMYRYDPRALHIRKRQGRIAKHYGISAFAYTYHFRMILRKQEDVLDLMMKDNEPNLDFMLIWTPEIAGYFRHKSRQKGGLEPRWIRKSSWKLHFDWLLPHFLHTRYLNIENKMPILGLDYRLLTYPSTSAMLIQWQSWAVEAGLKGIHFIQCNDVSLLETQVMSTKEREIYQQHAQVQALAEIPKYPYIPANNANNGLKYKYKLKKNKIVSYQSINSSVYRQKIEDYKGRHHYFGDPHYLGSTPTSYHYGVSTSYNDGPLTYRGFGGTGMMNGYFDFYPSHPSMLQMELFSKLRLSSSTNGLVFVNAWNQWGTGQAIEPSHEFGMKWLRAIQTARKMDAYSLHFPNVPIAGVGNLIKFTNTNSNTKNNNNHDHDHDKNDMRSKLCIIVRTFLKHDDGNIYSFRDFLLTILRQERKNIKVIVANTDQRPFGRMEKIIEECREQIVKEQQLSSVTDIEIEVIVDNGYTLEPYTSRVAGYNTTDAIIANHITSSDSVCSHFVATNGDNFYSPDAFNQLPNNDEVMTLMNFYGRYKLVNSAPDAFKREMYIYSNGVNITDDNGFSHPIPPRNINPKIDPTCCERLDNYECMDSSPAQGYVDLGAIIFNSRLWMESNVKFMDFNGICKIGCHDGQVVTHLMETLKYNYSQHPSGVCAFLHNPNPTSCNIVGGYYWDALTYKQAGCYANIDEINVDPLRIDWGKFVAHDGCVCERVEAWAPIASGLSAFTFDAEDYLKRYPDIAKKHNDPYLAWLHFIRYGHKEGRKAKRIKV